MGTHIQQNSVSKVWKMMKSPIKRASILASPSPLMLHTSKPPRDRLQHTTGMLSTRIASNQLNATRQNGEGRPGTYLLALRLPPHQFCGAPVAFLSAPQSGLLQAPSNHPGPRCSARTVARRNWEVPSCTKCAPGSNRRRVWLIPMLR